MGKKTTATSTKSSPTGKDPVEPVKAKRAAEDASGKKAPLAKKAVKAVAAVALGVGSAIAAKRTKRKPAAKLITEPATSEPVEANKSPDVPTQQEIALRAYFISEARRTAGLAVDPHQDWLDAERELLATPRRQAS